MDSDKHKILEAGLRGKELLLKGVIIPGDKDEHSVMVSIVLSTDEELDFVIERDATGDKLFDHLRKWVEVKGFIQELETGIRTIRITDYRVLAGFN